MSKFYLLLDLVGALVGVVFVMTQIMYPAMQGTKLFPLFRKKTRELESLIETEKTAQADAELIKTLQQMRKAQKDD